MLHQGQFEYIIQENACDDPILDIKFNIQHSRVVITGCGLLQIFHVAEDSE